MMFLSDEGYYMERLLVEAFDLGLDTALFILERTAGLSYDDQMEIIKEIKGRVEGGKNINIMCS